MIYNINNSNNHVNPFTHTLSLSLSLVGGIVEPGIIPRNTFCTKRAPDASLAPEDYDVTGDELKYCPVCLFYRPRRVKHCRVCKNCVIDFDHHCVWLGMLCLKHPIIIHTPSEPVLVQS